jgi:hypothetical protein
MDPTVKAEVEMARTARLALDDLVVRSEEVVTAPRGGRGEERALLAGVTNGERRILIRCVARARGAPEKVRTS